MVTLSDRQLEAIGADGFTVAASFLGPELAKAASDAAAQALAAGSFHRAGVRRGADHQVDDGVRGDSILWLDESAAEPWRSVRARFDELRLELNERAYLGLRRIELQLAHYPGTGAHYQRHRDAFPGDDNRRFTAIVYLNPRWSPEHGGQLQLHVEPPRTVEPTLDAFVAFRSEVVEHEVLPSHADRFALTAWYSAR